MESVSNVHIVYKCLISSNYLVCYKVSVMYFSLVLFPGVIVDYGNVLVSCCDLQLLQKTYNSSGKFMTATEDL